MMRVKPIRSRKLRASIFTVGWRLTKPLTASAENSITPIATVTAAIITETWSTMPTAVMTESRENTMSRRTIWIRTLPNAAPTLALLCPSSPSRFSWISKVLLPSRKSPPRIRIRSRPEISCPSTVNSGAVSPMTQLRDNSNRTRMTSAIPSPRRRASCCLSSGSLSTRIEMKMMLSIPSTISRANNVRKAIHISGLSNISIRYTFLLVFGGDALGEVASGLVHGVGGLHPLLPEVGGAADDVGGDGGGQEQEGPDHDEAVDEGRVAGRGGGDEQRDYTQEHHLARRVQLVVHVGHPYDAVHPERHDGDAQDDERVGQPRRQRPEGRQKIFLSPW